MNDGFQSNFQQKKINVNLDSMNIFKFRFKISEHTHTRLHTSINKEKYLAQNKTKKP